MASRWPPTAPSRPASLKFPTARSPLPDGGVRMARGRGSPLYFKSLSLKGCTLHSANCMGGVTISGGRGEQALHELSMVSHRPRGAVSQKAFGAAMGKTAGGPRLTQKVDGMVERLFANSFCAVRSARRALGAQALCLRALLWCPCSCAQWFSGDVVVQNPAPGCTGFSCGWGLLMRDVASELFVG